MNIDYTSHTSSRKHYFYHAVLFQLSLKNYMPYNLLRHIFQKHNLAEK